MPVLLQAGSADDNKARSEISGTHECQRCPPIDPSRAHWERGELSVSEVLKRLAMDVTHVGGAHYLTVIDCGPSRFAVWRRLRRQDSASVIDQLEQLFFER